MYDIGNNLLLLFIDVILNDNRKEEVEKIKNAEKEIIEIIFKINKDENNNNINNSDKKKYTEEIKDKL